MQKYEEALRAAVNSFRLWAQKNYPSITEETDNGEWCFCPEFDRMCACALEIINSLSASEATEQMIDDLLYVIARDNECSTVAEKLEEHIEWFSLLCRRCLHTGYINAKWQLVEHLPHYSGGDGLKYLVYDFLAAGDEYTERLALRALADIHPEQAERYAVQFWERNKYEYDEYQKIMVLHVLYQVHSDRLPHYLKLAKRSAYQYLRENAEKICVRLEQQERQGF